MPLTTYPKNGSGGLSIFRPPITTNRNPTSNDIQDVNGKYYQDGQAWINSVTSSYWIYTGGGLWAQQSTSAGNVDTLSGQTGTATPSSGNIEIAGTSNQVSTAASGSTVTVSLVGPYTPATYTAHGVLIGEGTSSIVAAAVGTTGQVLTGSSAADPAFAAIGTNSGLTAHGVLLSEGNSAFATTAVGATGQVFSGVTGSDPVWVNLPAFNVVDVTSGTQAMSVNTKYISDDGATKVVFTLPATAALGQTITVLGNGSGGWQIAQNALQQIVQNGNATTAGVTGSLSSTNHYNCVTLSCVVAGTSTIWNVSDSSGTLTFV